MSRADAPNIGRQIRRARLAAGLSQVELARELGQAERTIQAWEGNKRTPRRSGLSALALRLNVTEAFFWGDSDPSTATGAAA